MGKRNVKIHSKDTQGGGGEIPILLLLKSLLFSYIITGFFLLVLAFVLYRTGLSEKVVSVCIIGIYVAATFLAGFITGKKIGNRRFLWGLVEGCAYFFVLAAVSVCAGSGTGDISGSFATTFVLCAGGGMLGGMLS